VTRVFVVCVCVCVCVGVRCVDEDGVCGCVGMWECGRVLSFVLLPLVFHVTKRDV